MRSRVQSPSFSVRLATSFCRPFGRQLGLCLAGTVGLGLFSACDGNIGRAFDPRLDPPGGGGGGGGSPGVIQAAVAGGISRDGRPSVVEAFPTGGGWAPTVPIVVVFDESLNTTTVLPSTPTGTDAGVFVRDQTTMTVVPASYGFLAGNRVVVIRPSLPLQGVAMTQYEVVVDPEVRDADGIRVGGTEPMVVATFSPDVDTAEVDARLVTTVPIDNADDALTSDSVFAFFDRPAIPMSVNMTTFQVSPAGGSPLMKAPEFTFQTMGVDDTRVAALIPDTPFVAGGDVDIDLTRDVRFAMEGRLDVSAASPTSGFTVNGLEAPVTVELHSSSAGFPEKINAGNAGMVMMRVELPSSVLNNDRVFVRIYGSDATTASTVDVDFVEGSVTVPMDGATEVIVVLNNMLGDAQSRVFDDGELRFAARIERRSMVSGYTLGDADLNPALDFTVPEIVLVGPPTSGEGEVYAFDQDRFVLHGRASEELAAAELVANNLTVPMFASAENGRFMMNPMPVAGRETSFTLLITDVAGNMAVAPFAGIAVQRGVVSGDVSIGGELSVSVFDDETLLPVGGAMVFIDPMEPTVPSNSSRRVAVTGGDGFAIQGGLPSPRHTITVVAPGYDLVTLYDTPASQVSLPLRPTAESPSQISGTLAFVPMQPANTTALIGTGVFEDHALLAVQNTNANLTMIPTTNVRPNRLAVVGAVGGIFEPTTARAFTAIGCGLCGLTGMTPTPAPTPVGPGDDLGVQIGVIPEASIPGLAIETASLIPLNFGQAGGLDTGSLSAPFVRVLTRLDGIPGQTLIGVGAANGTGSQFTVSASFSPLLVASYLSYVPTSWVATQVQDGPGNISRHRALITDPTTGQLLNVLQPPGIPALTSPTMAVTGPPELRFADRLNLNATIIGGHAMNEVTITDAQGRGWIIFRDDLSPATGEVVMQLPALEGATGLALGDWTVSIEAHLWFNQGMGSNFFLFEERLRSQVTWGRAADVVITVN